MNLKRVMDEMATVDSLFMGINAHKGAQGAKEGLSEPGKNIQKSAAPAVLKAVVSAAPFSLEPAGTRYEAEAGELSGKASARNSSVASGGTLLAGMRGASCTMTVDGSEGGRFDLTIGFATANKVACTLAINEHAQSLQLPRTGGWNTLGAATLEVELKPGQNKIEITSKGGMKLDYFDFKAQ